MIDAYVRAVTAGEIPAGKYHRLACARHLRDREREAHDPTFPFRFDGERVERFVKFAQLLKHYKGEWAGQFVRLEPHQVFRLGSLFGWVHRETGLRRFRHSYNELPRKNGKTLEAAIVMLYVTFFDAEPGAEGYTIAVKRDQAKLVFNDCKRLVQSSGLKDRIAARVANLHREASASKLEPLGADHDSTDGLNPHAVCVDELHAYKDRGLLDVMETATGARRQPVIFKITTAGNDPVSPGGDEHDYATKILDGVLTDDTYFAFIAHADPEDPWQEEATWRKANPNYGVSVKPDDLRALATKAIHMPAAAATFKQKRLDLWVNTFAPCLSVEGWKHGQSEFDPDELMQQPCYIGIDLASKIDLCALSLVFPPTETRSEWRVLQHLWTPEETLRERAHRDRAPYDRWVDQGWLHTTPGTEIDQDVIRQAIADARLRYDIEVIGFDPWHAGKLITELVTEDGFREEQVLAVPQTFSGMSAACLKVQADILGGAINARGCPVTAWCVSNVVGNVDGKGNLMFAKGKSRGRIDPVISLTIATALWIRQPSVISAYEDRGALVM